ncbi:O-antigen ligase family protein [Aggregatimonas sangjinii]|uniref:O-antigen ligase family protein n=1 Tax=Aggregatimonas sangjinii TaxID=2583587 RepID=A0A5B7SSU8_9FLAO|nr:O-antigen ligase family protein [Aggregatimonas sangjinii]QCX01855.1 O-antigen ligase family protein [Aggregatimonas sangjinii]
MQSKQKSALAKKNSVHKGNHILQRLPHVLLYLWAVTVFYLPFSFVFYFFIASLLIKAIYFKEYQNITMEKGKIPYLLLLLFVLWNLVTLFYSEDLYQGLKQVEKKIPFLLISILGLIGDHRQFNFKRVTIFFLFGLLTVVLLSLLYTVYLFYDGHYLAVTLVKGFNEVNMLVWFEHRLYIGILLLMGIPLLLNKIVRVHHLTLRISWLLSLGLVCFILYSSGSRILVILMLIIFLLAGMNVLKQKIQFRYYVLTLLIAAIVAGTFIYKHPRTRLTLDLIQKNKPLDKIDSRLATWENAIDIIMKNPVFGVGIGDGKTELLDAYKKNGNRIELENELNVHNQYLQTMVESGILGLLFLLLFLFSLFWGVNRKEGQFWVFVLVFGAGFFVESILARNIGVFPMTFWMFVLLSTRSVENEKDVEYDDGSKWKKTFLVSCALISAFILIGVFLWAKSKSFDSKDPKTYMTAPFIEVGYSDLPLKKNLPEKTAACSFKDLEAFSTFERGSFIAPEIFRTQNDGPVAATAGIWCYLSENCNLKEAYIYAWNRVDITYRIDYDMSKKGSWQYLEMTDKGFSERFAIGVRMDLAKEFAEIKGMVLFALPDYKIDKIDSGP